MTIPLDAPPPPLEYDASELLRLWEDATWPGRPEGENIRGDRRVEGGTGAGRDRATGTDTQSYSDTFNV